MVIPLTDTAQDARSVHAKLLSRLTPGARATRVRDLSLTANMFAMAGMRRRHQDASEGELLLRLAALRLGADLVEQVYGWRTPPDGA